ncbi:hypothetical protein FZ103_00250 [Streptomonospora sp. PA3]|uniref:hypothetical protein n=1 Tax=Streptomonospora sp. PA3 TaxID=2607326 RepID=UPI0012DC55A8|nr:hypothetical protein [Streptomonospora sp. PA3]MUL39624.1 hypothetical protein [Streptomonospora sp. PA3]
MDALFSTWECQQLRGQVDIWDAIAEAEAETPAAPQPRNGALFAMRVLDEPADGALFGIGV